jgi:hypothetical protein
MFQEYALEPELVATWADRSNYRHFLGQFDVGKARLVADFPDSWVMKVRALSSDFRDTEKKRIEVLLTQIRSVATKRRGAVFDEEALWIVNAEREHERQAFHAIMARENPKGAPHILVGDDADDGNVLWRSVTGIIVNRDGEDIARTVNVLLRSARYIFFIDPFLSPTGSAKKRRAMDAYLKAVAPRAVGCPPVQVEFQMNGERCGGSHQDFERDCQARARFIPAGLSVRFLRWKERPGGLRLHNRYILTEFGGVQLGHGLDEGDEGDSDDMTLLDREQYQVRWSQYVGQPPAFDLYDQPIDVTGTCRP